MDGVCVAIKLAKTQEELIGIGTQLKKVPKRACKVR